MSPRLPRRSFLQILLGFLAVPLAASAEVHRPDDSAIPVYPNEPYGPSLWPSYADLLAEIRTRQSGDSE